MSCVPQMDISHGILQLEMPTSTPNEGSPGPGPPGTLGMAMQEQALGRTKVRFSQALEESLWAHFSFPVTFNAVRQSVISEHNKISHSISPSLS